jgi:hypothetical protein
MPAFLFGYKQPPPAANSNPDQIQLTPKI